MVDIRERLAFGSPIDEWVEDKSNVTVVQGGNGIDGFSLAAVHKNSIHELFETSDHFGDGTLDGITKIADMKIDYKWETDLIEFFNDYHKTIENPGWLLVRYVG